VPSAFPLRFGVAGGSSLRSFAEVADVARRAEAAGYSSLTANDHLHSNLAPMPVLTAAAAVTTNLILATLVLANDFRHPVMIAKEVATVDVLSGGRFELGIGTGWEDADYDTMGIPKARAGLRIDRLGEAVEIITGALAGEPFDLAGDHYSVRGLVGTPRLTRPRVPLNIGGGGRRILTYAAETADIVGVNLSFASGRLGPSSGSTGTLDHVRERVAWVRDAAAGRAVELQCRVHAAVVGDATGGLVDLLVDRMGMSADEIALSPYVLVGTEVQVQEKIERCADTLGLTYWVVPHDALDALAPIVGRLAG
jgi:probable F420-dependent oxidoreductase